MTAKGKIMKKLSTIFAVVTLLLTFTFQPAFAADNVISMEVEYLEDGGRYVTIIEDVPTSDIQPLSTKTETKSKTAYYENAAGKVMWYVKVTGTFTYGDGTSKCISATPSAASQNSDWKVSNVTGGKSGNKAYATATGKKYLDGTVIDTKTKTVTLTCSPTGVFS